MSNDAENNLSHRRWEFERTWRPPTGFRDWFATVNNQPFGNRFMMASLAFFSLAGVLALMMRVQLAVPDNTAIGPLVYNQLFTMHGSTMMYLVMLPFLEGLAIYLLPIMLGTREMAYPRMSAFSFWVFFSGGLVFFAGFLFNAVPDAGWFVYPPLSLSKFSGLGLDFLLVGLGFIEIAGVGAGVEIVATILKFRAPGMTLGRMPLFAWAWLVTAVMIIVAFSTLFGATVLIELDRAVGTKFFEPEGGGNVLLWQHLFWFFGHPDVYIMFIPATGMVSMIVPTFARRPIAGYKLIAVAILITGFVSFGLWAHHMFTAGLPTLSMGFFAASSLMIAIASGTQVFAWIATMWGSKPDLKLPMLFVLGFLVIFTLGGITGVMVAIVPFDWQVHDTYFVVAHFHYVLIGGVFFPMIAGIYYWMPLITGRMPNEKLGKWSFWLIFIGFNATFFPMHIMGLKGMARRVYTYAESLEIGGLNLFSSVFSFVLAAGFILVVINVFWSRKFGLLAKKNPWGSGSLEWSVTEEMPNYVYLTPPIVSQHDPLWPKPFEKKAPADQEKIAQELTASPSLWRAALITDAVTAEPQSVQRVAGPTYVPIVAAAALLVTSIATLAQTYLLALVALICTIAMAVVWLWPTDAGLKPIYESDVAERTGLPVAPTGAKSSGWWAMIGLLSVVATVFGVLFYSYFYIWLYSPSWPQEGLPLPTLLPAGIGYGLAVVAAVLVGKSVSYLKKGGLTGVFISMAFGLVVAIASFTLILADSVTASFSPQQNAYGSLFHTIIWHVAILCGGGIGFILAAVIKLALTKYKSGGYMKLQFEITALYWYFTAAVCLLTFAAIYLSPRLL